MPLNWHFITAKCHTDDLVSYIPCCAAEHDVYDLQALHEKHGPLVRYGSDQVSVADWEAYKTIYMGQNSSFLKDPIYYRGFYVRREVQ
jgi:hypothetical protein